jgi:hypothetical protein
MSIKAGQRIHKKKTPLISYNLSTFTSFSSFLFIIKIHFVKCDKNQKCYCMLEVDLLQSSKLMSSSNISVFLLCVLPTFPNVSNGCSSWLWLFDKNEKGMMRSLRDVNCVLRVSRLFWVEFRFLWHYNKSTAFTNKQHSLFLSQDGFHCGT